MWFKFVLISRGIVDAGLLRSAWESVTGRHGILRTSFVWEGRERALQVVWRRAALPWREEDWRADSEAERAARWDRYLAADRRCGFFAGVGAAAASAFDPHRGPVAPSAVERSPFAGRRVVDVADIIGGWASLFQSLPRRPCAAARFASVPRLCFMAARAGRSGGGAVLARNAAWIRIEHAVRNRPHGTAFERG